MNFDLDKTIQYWVDGAAYDLATGKSLLKERRFPYALFFGHLALEKILKALVVRSTGEHAPYTHSLLVLASKLDFKIPEPVMDQLAESMEFHIEARYPDEQKAFYEKCTESFTLQKYNEIEKVYQWLIEKLSKSFPVS